VPWPSAKLPRHFFLSVFSKFESPAACPLLIPTDGRASTPKNTFSWSCPISNFYFPFSKGGRSFPAASFASARNRPLNSPALKRLSRQSSGENPRPAAPASASYIPHTKNQVAVAIAPSSDARNHMVQAPHHRCQPAQAVKAPPALARVDRLPQRPGFQENPPSRGCPRQADAPHQTDDCRRTLRFSPRPLRRISSGKRTLDHVTALLRSARRRAPLATRPAPLWRAARRVRHAPRASHGMEKQSWQPPLQPAVPQQMRIIPRGHAPEVQPRHHQVFQLFSHVYRVELSVFHVHCPLVGRHSCLSCRGALGVPSYVSDLSQPVGQRFLSVLVGGGGAEEGRAPNSGSPPLKRKSPGDNRDALLYNPNPITLVTALSRPKLVSPLSASSPP